MGAPSAPLRSDCALLGMWMILLTSSISFAQDASMQPDAGPSRREGPTLRDGPTIRPPVLDSRLPDFVPLPELAEEPDLMLRWPVDSPLGYSGPSGILPREEQENSHFVPMEDRWRVGLPAWDRYDQGHPPGFEYPY